MMEIRLNGVCHPRCLARTNDESRPDVSFPQLVQSSESVAEYTDLDWFKQQQLNPQNPFDIIPVRETASSYTGHEADSTLHQLYGNISRHCGPPGRKSPSVINHFPEMKTLSPRFDVVIR